MLISAVITLQAARDCRYDHFTGRGAHGFWLKSWRAVDPRVGDWLHAARWHLPLNGGAPCSAHVESGESIAPYCVSPVMDLPEPRGGAQEIPAGALAWLRVTAFHPDLARRILEGPRAWLANLPERISIDGAEWRLTGATADPAGHPWAGMESYEALRHAALDCAAPPRGWKLRFQTPTAIRGAKIDGRDTYLLFPLPDRLLDSWRRAWNAYARCAGETLEIDEALAAQARDTLRVTHYRLQTRVVKYQYASNHSSRPRVEVPVTGYTGESTFESLDSPPVRAVEDLLFRFAFFRGVGYHTTQGLGQILVEPQIACDADRG